MIFAIDKLQVIQNACELTGDNVPIVAEDGSEEWAKASVAYEMALPYAIEGGNWKFGTKVVTLTPTGVVPTDTQFDTACAKPPDCLHLIWVMLNAAPVVYQILNNQIVLNAQGQTPITAKIVAAPTMDQVTPTFATALTSFVMSGIYRGLHENISEADKMWAKAESLLDRAKTRSDQEQPKRAMFNSRLTAARSVRRPWPREPSGWNGTGIST